MNFQRIVREQQTIRDFSTCALRIFLCIRGTMIFTLCGLDRIIVDTIHKTDDRRHDLEHCRHQDCSPLWSLISSGASASGVKKSTVLSHLSLYQRSTMTLSINDLAPDFEAETTEGRTKFHDWLGDSWAVLFSHPKNFTPVCTTELGYIARIKPEFDKRGVKVIGLSVDPVEKHAGWSKDIEETQGFAPNYPIIGDSDFNVSKLYGMLPASVSGDPAVRTAADNQTVRNVFVIGPDKRIKLILVYPMSTGRNFDEVLRVLDSLQLTAKHKVATPVNWKEGEDVIILTSVNDEDARKQHPTGWTAPKPYLRIVAQPKP
jgi:alkyl hydroperoxide reductase subunit AhpC